MIGKILTSYLLLCYDLMTDMISDFLSQSLGHFIMYSCDMI